MAKRLVTITVSEPGFTANETFASRADGQAWREMIEATLSHREKDDFDLALYAAGLASLSRLAALLYDSAAGFDISSFQTDGSQKRIEVKTTQGPVSTPFFISLNEVLASREAPLTYSIYRVFEHHPDSGRVKYFELPGDVELSCGLIPVNFRAYPGKGDEP